MRVYADGGACRDAAVLAGCANNQDAGTVVGAITGGIIGNQFGKGGGKVASTLAGAVVGGIVGNEIGRSLDRARPRVCASGRVRRLGARASAAAGALAQSQNGRYGEVIAEDYYDRGGSRCRNFVHRVYIDGRAASHARHRLPQSRRHLDASRLTFDGCRTLPVRHLTFTIRAFSSPRPSRPGLSCFCTGDWQFSCAARNSA